VLKHNKQVPEMESLQVKAPVVNPSQPRKQVKLSSSQEKPMMIQAHFKPDPALEKLGQESLGEDFFAPAPRYASKIQWEVVGEETECSSPTHKSEDSEKLNPSQ